jgi:hypothetical protein
MIIFDANICTMKQITSRVPDDLYEDISLIAKEARHSLSITIETLLRQAVKERKRKRRGKNEENNS